jgi:hypothetical protein
MARVGDNRGMALIGVLTLSALLLSLAIALAVWVNSDTQLRGAFGSEVTGFYAAESGLNEGMGEFRNIFLDYDVPSGSDFDARSFSLANRQVTYQLTERPGNPQNIVIPAGELFAGVSALQYRYTITSKATTANSDIEAAVGADFLVGYLPLFQFVAFYKNDLEVSPGPAMHLQGLVHTNGDLYLNGTSGPLYIEDNPPAGVFTVQVSAGKDIYRGRKSDNQCNGTVWVDMLEDTAPADGNLDPRALLCNGGATRKVPTSELAQWKGSMIAGLGNIAVPTGDIIKPPLGVSPGGATDPGVYWQKADLRIVLHVNRNGQLPGGAALPYLIEVVDAGGAQDPARTAQLYAFMSDGAWNAGQIAGRGPSSFPGTMPIFVTDLPFAAGSGCMQGTPACANTVSNSYAPALPAAPQAPLVARTLAAPAGVYTEAMGQGNPVGGPFSFDLDYRRGGFYNWREQKWMLLLNINVRDLIVWNAQNGEPFFATADSSEGGLVIFATIDGPDSALRNDYGVRVFGSADLPILSLVGQPDGIGVATDPTGVTVASDQAMDVIGDFNRGTAAGGLPRQPASLIGDSINILSAAYWRSANPALCAGNCCSTQFCRDGQSVLGLDDAARGAQTTWVNAGLLGGVDTTPSGFPGSGSYNGGLENYPRLHEDWSNSDLNYQGSFVSLGEPAHVNGRWCGSGDACNIYNPPNRNWSFDAAFGNTLNLPPLTPRFVYVQQVLFTEEFK